MYEYTFSFTVSCKLAEARYKSEISIRTRLHTSRRPIESLLGCIFLNPMHIWGGGAS